MTDVGMGLSGYERAVARIADLEAEVERLNWMLRQGVSIWRWDVEQQTHILSNDPDVIIEALSEGYDGRRA